MTADRARRRYEGVADPAEVMFLASLSSMSTQEGCNTQEREKGLSQKQKILSLESLKSLNFRKDL